MSTEQPTPAPPAPTEGQAATADPMQVALKALQAQVMDPVGALASTYGTLTKDQPMVTGGIFMGLFAVCALVVVLLGARAMPFSLGMYMRGDDFSIKLRLLLLMVSYPVGVAVGLLVVRSALKGKGDLGLDVFAAGSALVPMGFALLVSGLTGLDFGSLLLVIAATLMVLVVFTALTRVSGLKDGQAAYATGGILLVAGLVVRIVGSLLF